MPDFQSLVERKLEPIGESGNDVIYRCPKCEGDIGSGHLYVNYNKGKYNCFKCSFRGRYIESLLKYLNIDISFDYTKLYDEREKILDTIIDFPKEQDTITPVEFSKDLRVLTSYFSAHTTSLSSRAIQYLLDRKVSISLMNSLCMREGLNRYGEDIIINNSNYIGRDYSGRILVPSLQREGTISFYVGRDYIGDKESKYKNCSSDLAIASEDVWNLDMIESDIVIICEGVFTAIAVNQALNKSIAVATYGKSIAEKANSSIRVTSQGEKLINRNFKRYVIFYDKDALISSLDTCDYLYDRGCTVNLVLIPPALYGPKADAADMTTEEIKYLISNSIPYNSLTRTIVLEDILKK